MSSQSRAKSPEALRAMVAGTLANFQHPTLKHNLTTLKALHHVAWLDDTLHIELQMPFVWTSAFDALKEQTSSELLRITGAKAIDWKLSHSIATLKRVKNQPGVNGVKNIIAVSSGKGGWVIIYRRESGACTGGRRGEGRHSGCGYLWPVHSKHAGGGKPASNFAGRHPHGANRGARSGDQLHWISGY